MASSQLEAIRRIWTIHLTGNRFIRGWRLNKIIDIDFLVDDVLGKKEPTNYDALKSSPIKILVACFNITKQRVDYFSNQDITPDVLRASKAMPIVYGKKVVINNDLYTDNPYSPLSMVDDNKELLEEKILCVDFRETNPFIVFISKMFVTPSVEKTNENVFMIIPNSIPGHLLSSSKEILEQTFDQGYHYALSHKEELLTYLWS